MRFEIRSRRCLIAVSIVITFFTHFIQKAGAQATAQNTPPEIYVDNNGRMRRADTGKEVRYYGTNYTLPFAHAYRAMNRLGVDHKQAIDRDVYHLSRLGLNAFRLHLWDVELSDSTGNLLENEHLDLLDYLIAQLEARGISIILTAQTNFGNGYPERDTDTGAYSYDYGKCDIHANPEAIKAQQRYVGQLVSHVNPYNRQTYAADRSIIAIEVNNEPCHQSSPRQVTDYINAMVKSIRKGGWKKPILYNVSHNMDMVSGYYAADIQGTTYQWYPIGLVSGHERRGNFLPYVDNYAIPFSDVKGFSNKAKVVYEFDPADMLESYIFPAIARTFAREGFQWATQFAYDPIDMARFNTEYQTHYLNLAYTPQKALGMRIAAHVMKHTPNGAETGKYPADTIFGDVTVSYRRNLALLNSPEEYVHTNNVEISPVSPESLRHIAGFGSSPIVGYEGRGAYFLDKVTDGVWRLEVMPDVLYSADPFEKPSLSREPAHIISTTHPMMLSIPGLGDTFSARALTDGNTPECTARHGIIPVSPGVYLLAATREQLNTIDPAMRLGNITLNEYVAPPVTPTPLHVNHIPAKAVPAGQPLTIRAEAFGDVAPDMLVVYPSDASFWRKDNRLYTMTQTAPYTYETTIPADALLGKDSFSYRIAAVSSNGAKTFPGAHNGLPLDWDAPEGGYYTTALLRAGEPIALLDAANGLNGIDLSTIPDEWSRSHANVAKHSPTVQNAFKISVTAGNTPVRTILTSYIGDIIANIPNIKARTLTIRTGTIEALDTITVALVDRDGITYSKQVALIPGSDITIPLEELTISNTLLCPAPYPVFLSREFTPDGYTTPLQVSDVEKLQLTFPGAPSDKTASVEIIGAWLQ